MLESCLHCFEGIYLLWIEDEKNRWISKMVFSIIFYFVIIIFIDDHFVQYRVPCEYFLPRQCRLKCLLDRAPSWIQKWRWQPKLGGLFTKLINFPLYRLHWLMQLYYAWVTSLYNRFVFHFSLGKTQYMETNATKMGCKLGFE